MDTRGLLIDNDAFLLLAGAGLLKQSIAVLGFQIEEARRLRTLEFMLRKPARAFRRFPPDVVTRALEACAAVKPLEEGPSVEYSTLFENTVGIDAGEAILYSVAAERQLHVIASNDKAAMRALASGTAFQALQLRLRGRVACMELILKRLLDTHGPGYVFGRFEPILKIDSRVHAILSPAASGRPEDCVVGARSFLAGLCRELGLFLLDE